VPNANAAADNGPSVSLAPGTRRHSASFLRQTAILKELNVMSLFARQTTFDPADPVAPLEAYKEGRRDERRQIEAGVFDRRLVKKDIDEAYDRGRQVGLARRQSSPLGLLSFALLAVLIIATAVMVMTYGSFAAAGGVIDHLLSSIA
jgi:hypothetical protein